MSSDDDESKVNVIPMDSFASDGDMNTWPGHPYAERNDQKWRELLATNWLAKMGSLEADTINILDKLPDGYCLFDKPNLQNPHIRNPSLFGHPSGRAFPSQNTFLDHFMSLVQGNLDTCICKPCQTMSGRKKGRPPKTSTPQPIYNDRRPTDEEGPDYWKMMVMKLKEKGEIDEDIEQESNIDWVLTHDDLADYFMKLVIDPAYVPRRGELVLWVWSGLEDGSLMHNPETGVIEVFGKDNKWHGTPNWRAGVVTQTPHEEVHMVDIIDSPDSLRGLSYSGFRVETLPDPLGTDKSYSRQYSYVPLRNIKPLNAWQIFLRDLNREDMHPSIENALTVMSSWSFVHKFHAKSERSSDLRILCKGIFVGAELLAVHDTIRLKPQGYHYNQHKVGETSKVTDVMIIDEIAIVLTDCIDDPNDEQLANQYKALISGKMFTTNPQRGIHGGPFAEIDPTPLSIEEATETFRQAGMSEYGPWYRMANGKTCNISPHHIIGRCYEPLAAQLMFSTHSFGYDLSSVMEGRNYSEHVDQRMPVGNTWFWGDSRVETLGLTEINGVECGKSASQRETPAKWQAVLQIAQGETNHAVRRRAGIPSSAGRPFGAKNGTSSRRNSGFAGVASTSKLVSSAIGSTPDDDSDDSENEDEDTSGMADDNVAVEINVLELGQAKKRSS